MSCALITSRFGSTFVRFTFRGSLSTKQLTTCGHQRQLLPHRLYRLSSFSTMSDPLVLVTGASGYVGAWVVKTLQEAGYRVRGTVRSLKDPAKLQPLYDLCPDAKHKLELVEAELLDEKSWISAVEGCTYIQHIASPFPGDDVKDENKIIQPAVEGTLGVLRAAAQVGGVKRIVLTSSAIAVSFVGGNKEPYSEKDWTDLKHPASTAYAKSKHLAEKAAWDFLKELPHAQKFEMATVNPVLVMGPPVTKSSGTSISFLKGVLMKEMPGLPAFYVNMCDIRDVARAHLECMTNPDAVGNRHLVHTRPVFAKEIGEILAKEFKSQGYDPVTRQIPTAVVWMMTWFNKEMNGRYHTLRQPMPFDTSRLRNVLKIEPTPIEKSLVDMAYGLIEIGIAPKKPKYTGPPK